jgi:hypothetical protein
MGLPLPSAAAQDSIKGCAGVYSLCARHGQQRLVIHRQQCKPRNQVLGDT